MARVNSILLAAEREDAVHQSVNRALMLARYLDARLDILLCDLYRPFTAGVERPLPNVAEAHAFLAALRNSVSAPDVEITTDAAFEGTLHEHVAKKVRLERSSLVIKGVARAPVARDSQLNWQLIRSSPAPLLLTRGNPWQPRPRFAAVVDMRQDQSPALSAAVIDIATSVQHACGAKLDFLCLPGRTQSLTGLGAGPERLHVLGPDETLPQFVAERRYDLVALAVCEEHSGFGVERRLADKLLAHSFDLLLTPRRIRY